MNFCNFIQQRLRADDFQIPPHRQAVSVVRHEIDFLNRVNMEEDLDAILDFAKNYFSAIPFTIDELFIEAKAKPMSKLWGRNLEKNALADYVKYLVGKEYIGIDCTTDEGTRYKITPEGKIHVNSEGFVRQREVENSYRQSTINTNSSVVRTNKFQNVALVITSLVAVGALLLQFFSYRRDANIEAKMQLFEKKFDSFRIDFEENKIRQKIADTFTQVKQVDLTITDTLRKK
jgi:hypothetical protein